MQGRTHALGGLLASCVALNLAGLKLDPGAAMFAVGAGMVGSLLPDIDHPNSAFGRELPVVSESVSFFVGHRGALHSFVAALCFGIAVWVVFQRFEFSFLLALAFTLGYLSHLFLDMLTPSGVPLFWPLSKKFSVPFVHTGSFLENYVVFPVLLVILLIVGGKTVVGTNLFQENNSLVTGAVSFLEKFVIFITIIAEAVKNAI